MNTANMIDERVNELAETEPNRLVSISPNKLLTVHAELTTLHKELTDKALKPLEKALEKVEGALAIQLEQHDLSSVSNETHTAYFRSSEHFNLADRESYINWLVENQAWHLITNHLSREGIRELDNPPPGVQVYATRKLIVRRK